MRFTQAFSTVWVFLGNHLVVGSKDLGHAFSMPALVICVFSDLGRYVSLTLFQGKV